MKYKAGILAVLLLFFLAFSACTTEAKNEQTASDSDIMATEQATAALDIVFDEQTTETPGYSKPISTPEFFNDIGKKLSILKNEQPRARFIVRLDGFPDAAAACFGEQEWEYAYCFFGGQSGDFKKAMDECEEELRCAGFCSVASVLFPEMEDDMSFSEFFSLIGVSDYEYDSEESSGQGWLYFKYYNMDVCLNTNEINAEGGWNFTANERVNSSAPASIIEEKIYGQNQKLADAVMFE